MRKIIALIILSVILLPLYALESSAQLYLKAYKSGATDSSTTTDGKYTNLFVVDAITSNPNNYDVNLGNLNSGRGEMDLTSDLTSLFGDISNDTPTTVVFSYRVESNDSGTYTISINANGPFKQESGSDSIGFKWSLDNVTFSTDETPTQGEKEESTGERIKYNNYMGDKFYEGGYKYVLVDTENYLLFKRYIYEKREIIYIDVYPVTKTDLAGNTGPITFETTTTTADSLIDKWQITDNSVGNVWYRRGTVALLIDRNNYNDASYGKYKTTVTVTLESND